MFSPAQPGASGSLERSSCGWPSATGRGADASTPLARCNAAAVQAPPEARWAPTPAHARLAVSPPSRRELVERDTVTTLENYFKEHVVETTTRRKRDAAAATVASAATLYAVKVEAPISTLISSLAHPRSSPNRPALLETEASLKQLDAFLQDLSWQEDEQSGAGGLWSWWRYQGLSG